MLREDEGAVGDAVHKVQRDPLDLLTDEHDEVVLDDQERVVCDENETLFFIVPVIHPENNQTDTERECVRPTVKKLLSGYLYFKFETNRIH